MTETIINSERSINILNQLILNGYYDGTVCSNRFELNRKRGLFNAGGSAILIGILNSDNKFDLNFHFKFPMNIIMKTTFGTGVVLSIVSLYYGNWFYPILFFFIPCLIVLIDFNLKKSKEINLLTSKFLELYKLEYGDL